MFEVIEVLQGGGNLYSSGGFSCIGFNLVPDHANATSCCIVYVGSYQHVRVADGGGWRNAPRFQPQEPER